MDTLKPKTYLLTTVIVAAAYLLGLIALFFETYFFYIEGVFEFLAIAIPVLLFFYGLFLLGTSSKNKQVIVGLLINILIALFASLVFYYTRTILF